MSQLVKRIKKKVGKKIKEVKKEVDIRKVVRNIKKVDKLLKKIDKMFMFIQTQQQVDNLIKEKKRLIRLRRALEGKLTIKQLQQKEVLIADVERVLGEFIGGKGTQKLIDNDIKKSKPRGNRIVPI